MPVVRFIEVEVLGTLIREVKPKTFDFGSNAIALKIGVEVDKELYEALDNDPLAHSKLQDAASDVYKGFLENAKAEVKKTDKAIQKLVGNPALQQAAADVCLASIKMLVKGLNKEVEAAIKAAWAQIKKTNTDYRDYKIGAAVSVGLKVGGVVISAVGIGGAVATGGVSAILGIYGMIKGCVGLVKELVKLALGAEKFRKMINDQVATLISTYNAEKKTIRNAQDVGKALINQVFQTEFATIKKCSGDVDQYLSKLDGMDVKSHEISKELGKTIKQVDAALKQMQDLTRNNKKLASALSGLETAVNTLIVDIVSKQQVINEGRAWGERVKTALDLLQKGKPGWVKAFEASFVLMDTAMAFNDLSASADKVLEIGFSAMDAARELQGDIREAMSS